MSGSQRLQIALDRVFFEISHISDELRRITHAGNRDLRTLEHVEITRLFHRADEDGGEAFADEVQFSKSRAVLPLPSLNG